MHPPAPDAGPGIGRPEFAQQWRTDCRLPGLTDRRPSEAKLAAGLGRVKPPRSASTVQEGSIRASFGAGSVSSGLAVNPDPSSLLNQTSIEATIWAVSRRSWIGGQGGRLARASRKSAA